MDIQDSLPLILAVEGREWILNETGIEPEELQKIYAGPTSCYVRQNNTNEENANIFTAGTIIGFLSSEDYSQLREIQAKVDFSLEFIVQTPKSSFMASPILIVNRAKHKKPRKKYSKPEFKDKQAYPITEKQFSKQKHPISNLAFAAKRNLESFFQKNDNKVGIYCIYSNDFATYIGQARNIGKRLRQHVRALNKGKHHNNGLQHAWGTKGASKFTFFVIQECDEDELDELELLYIEKYRTFDFGYNSTPDGQGYVLSEGSLEPLNSGIPDCSNDTENEADELLQNFSEDLVEVSTEYEERGASVISSAEAEDPEAIDKGYTAKNIELNNNNNSFKGTALESTHTKFIDDNEEPEFSSSSSYNSQDSTKEVLAEKARPLNLEKTRSKGKKTAQNNFINVNLSKKTEEKCSATKERLDALLIDLERYIAPSGRKFLSSIRELPLVKKLKVDGLIMSKALRGVSEFAERLDRSAVHLSKNEKQDFEARLLKIKQVLNI